MKCGHLKAKRKPFISIPSCFGNLTQCCNKHLVIHKLCSNVSTSM
ncbi:hypothetical protein HanPSC8_Chr05g0211531 [Helianthus annuus]|nr:hypothetical protein HanPSC8_Chr05g0211531 [Helianthus annuus]